MSVDFRRLLTDLRTLVSALKARCTAAEARVESLRRELEEAQAHSRTLEEALRDVTTRYENLQAGLTAGGSGEGTDPEAVRTSAKAQRDRYLALVREIDDCIAKLERRG